MKSSSDNTPNYSVTELVNEHCATGENPYYHPDTDCVYWTDIPNGKIFAYDSTTRTHTTIYNDPGAQVGGFTLQENGDWLLFRETDLAVMDPDGQVSTLLPFNDEGAQRFNDVIADPEGRVFAGTIGKTKESGGLYRIDTDGTITKLEGSTGNGNGMAFSPDVQHFYWTDSTAKRIYRYRYDRATGEIADRTLFFQEAPDGGTPDGLVVDTNGNVWSARHRAGLILKHDQNDGRVLERIAFPTQRVTSMIFGGPERNILYVTTAGGGEPGSKNEDGALYQVTLNDSTVRGRDEFRSRVLLAG